MLLANLSQITPRDDVKPLRLFASVAIAGRPRAVDGYAECCDRTAVGRVPHFRVTSESPDDHDFV
jgi:hypothetical protein